MDADQLLVLVIEPVLKEMGMDSPAARNLLLGTAAHESHMGKYLKQVKGPALGIYQMEPKTHDDIWDNYLFYRPSLAKKVEAFLVPGHPRHEQLIWNLRYATLMARIHYRRVPDPLPKANDIPALAVYWDKHYNKNPDKGFPHQFEDDYGRYIE